VVTHADVQDRDAAALHCTARDVGRHCLQHVYQVAVYLAYAALARSAFIDRALNLPRSWTSEPARCRAAGVPEDAARPSPRWPSR